MPAMVVPVLVAVGAFKPRLLRAALRRTRSVRSAARKRLRAAMTRGARTHAEAGLFILRLRHGASTRAHARELQSAGLLRARGMEAKKGGPRGATQFVSVQRPQSNVRVVTEVWSLTDRPQSVY